VFLGHNKELYLNVYTAGEAKLFTPGFAANKNYASDLAFKQAVPKA
jgi:hypothetical protein